VQRAEPPPNRRYVRPVPAPLPQATLDERQRLACLRLIRSENVGPVTFRELVNHFGGAEPALAALPDLAAKGGRRRPIRIGDAAVAARELEQARRVGALPVFTIEPGYPGALATLEAPPPLVYVKGDTGLLQRPVIAVVGSRNASAAGIRFTADLAAGLGRAGWVVASGLARGIDAAAHRAAIDTGTVAVTAGGLDVVYPPEHEALQAEIAVRGCLVGEQPPGFKPRGQDFPRRNRIVSGIALGVVVVEAAARSGTLVTARMAAEQGREVMAVPGHPLDPRAEGTNRLIRNGATLIAALEHVLETMAPIRGPTEPMVPPDGAAPSAPRKWPAIDAGAPQSLAPPPSTLADADRRAVLEALGPAPVGIDDLTRATGLTSRAIQVALIELALAGRIERHGGQLVSLLGPPRD
jgi:DNA processing protein